MNKISNAICRSCQTSFSAEPKRTFLGFQRMTCPACKADVVYPLTRGYRITYWVFFALMVITIVSTFAQGDIGLPGGLGIAVLIALFRDWTIQKEVAVAQLPRAQAEG